MTKLRPSSIVLSIDVHELAPSAVTVDILARLVLAARLRCASSRRSWASASR
jgi:hypothetical protein